MLVSTRLGSLWLLSLLSAACLPEVDEAVISGQAIQLHPVELEPYCFGPTWALEGADTSTDSPSQAISAVRQLTEFQIDVARATVAAALKPLRDQPDRDRWNITFDAEDGRVHQEGVVLARGVALASIAASVYFVPSDPAARPQSSSAEIFHDGRSTRYRVATGEIEVGEQFVKTARLTRGCTPEGDRFENYSDALLQLQGLRCWGPSGALLYSSFGEHPPPSDPTRAAAALTCLQIREKVLSVASSTAR